MQGEAATQWQVGDVRCAKMCVSGEAEADRARQCHGRDQCRRLGIIGVPDTGFRLARKISE